MTLKAQSMLLNKLEIQGIKLWLLKTTEEEEEETEVETEEETEEEGKWGIFNTFASM